MSADVNSRLGAIEGKLDTVIDFHNQRLDKHENRLDGHDTEFSKVKKAVNTTRGWMLGLPGVAAALGWFIRGQ